MSGPSTPSTAFNGSPEYVHRLLDSLISGRVVDFKGCEVPADVQMKLARSREYVETRLTFVERCLLIKHMLDEVRNPEISNREDVLLQGLKVAEEAGEAAEAIIGVFGMNFRKGKNKQPIQVAEELVDTAVTALCAASSVMNTFHGWPDSEVRKLIDNKIRFLYGRVEDAVRAK